jgi:phosphoribosyl 1,2-cyclic phosphodiesterase
MSVLIKTIASGSSGNCYIIDDGVTTVVLECGISYDKIIPHIKRKKISGVLVSHEHKDHSKIVDKLLFYGYPMYLSSGTIKSCQLSKNRCHVIKSKQLFKIGSFDILPFDIQHDAEEPLGFLIKSNITGEKILFATDTYYLKYKFSGVNTYMIECNYDLDTLDHNIKKGLMPKSLKNRILKSHFSLGNLIKFLKETDLSKTNKIYLIHISSRNLDMNKAKKQIQDMTFAEVIVV